MSGGFYFVRRRGGCDIRARDVRARFVYWQCGGDAFSRPGMGSPLNDRVETKVCVAASQGNLLQEHENGLAEDSGSTAVLEGEILPAKTDNSEEVVFPWDDEEGF